MPKVDIAGVIHDAGGPGERFYACQPCGSNDLAFLMLEAVGSSSKDNVGQKVREVHADFHATFAGGPMDLRAWANRTNGQLKGLDSFFCSMFVGVIRAEHRELEYVNAGHSEAYFRHGDTREVEELPNGFRLLGIPDELEALSPTVARKAMNSGDLLLLTSSGVVDVVNEERERFGDDKLKALLGEEHLSYFDSHAMLRKLFYRLDRHGSTYAFEPMALVLTLTA